MIDLIEEALPSDLAPAETIVFPAIHGTFGEDGALQSFLRKLVFLIAEAVPNRAGFVDKHLSKEAVREAGVGCLPIYCFPTHQCRGGVNDCETRSGFGS